MRLACVCITCVSEDAFPCACESPVAFLHGGERCDPVSSMQTPRPQPGEALGKGGAAEQLPESTKLRLQPDLSNSPPPFPGESINSSEACDYYCFKLTQFGDSTHSASGGCQWKDAWMDVKRMDGCLATDCHGREVCWWEGAGLLWPVGVGFPSPGGHFSTICCDLKVGPTGEGHRVCNRPCDTWKTVFKRSQQEQERGCLLSGWKRCHLGATASVQLTLRWWAQE